MTNWRILIVLFLINTSGLVQAEVQLRVMTLNAEWLWTPFDNKIDGTLKSIRDMSPKDYQDEITFYAQLVRQTDTDILAISEIENERVAIELAAQIGPGWRAYFKQGLDTATGQDVALLSRLEFVEGSLTHFNFPAGKLQAFDKPKKLTKVVGAQFWVNSANGKEIVGVITAHFLSKRNENQHKAENRQKQAVALRQAIDTFANDTNKLLVLGDFNDQIDSPTLKKLIDAPLSSYRDCDNFKQPGQEQTLKRWKRLIDHILYRGVSCLHQEMLDLKTYSDHPAILGHFTLPR